MSDAVHLCHLLPLPFPTVCVCRDFSTEVDIALRKWAEDKGRLARLCTAAAQESVLEVLRSKIEVSRGEGADTVLRGEPLQEIVCRYMLVEYDLLLPPPLPSPSLQATKDGPFHSLSQGMRRYVEEQCRELHHWSPDNIDQLVRRGGEGEGRGRGEGEGRERGGEGRGGY